jgi:hypothetical protein
LLKHEKSPFQKSQDLSHSTSKPDALPISGKGADVDENPASRDLNFIGLAGF